MKKLTLRPFTESDWDVFAGAELFADGSQPLVQYSDPGGYALVVDGNGINVNLVQDHDDPTCAADVWVFTFAGVRSQRHGVALLNALLPGGVSREALAAASFEIVGTC